MPPVSQSREVLTTMDSGQGLPTLSFGRKNGWFLSRNLAVILVVVFLAVLLATGLLVYYYATPMRTEVHDAAASKGSPAIHTPVEASSNDFAAASVIGGGPPHRATTTKVRKPYAMQIISL